MTQISRPRNDCHCEANEEPTKIKRKQFVITWVEEENKKEAGRNVFFVLASLNKSNIK